MELLWSTYLRRHHRKSQKKRQMNKSEYLYFCSELMSTQVMGAVFIRDTNPILDLENFNSTSVFSSRIKEHINIDLIILPMYSSRWGSYKF
jgi:hypothetical protein